MRRYWARYLASPDPAAGSKREKVRRRQAAWAAANRARLTAKRRENRRKKTARLRLGMAANMLSAHV